MYKLKIRINHQNIFFKTCTFFCIPCSNTKILFLRIEKNEKFFVLYIVIMNGNPTSTPCLKSERCIFHWESTGVPSWVDTAATVSYEISVLKLEAKTAI